MNDDDHIFSLDPETVLRRSPLKAGAIARVLAAAGLPLYVEVSLDDGAWRKAVPEGIELAAIELTLAAVADVCASYRMLRAPLAASERDKVRTTFKSFMLALNDAAGAADGPPPPPQNWMQQMAAWAFDAEELPSGRRGRPTDPMEPKIYRLLLSFYEVAYGVPPGSGAGGPTSRFLEAFFSEMHRQFTASTRINPSSHAPDLASLFPPPSPDTIRNKIRQHRDCQERSDDLRLVTGYWQMMQQHLRASQGRTIQ